MSNPQSSNREEELSKKDRLINAWLAVGPEAKGKNVAEITDSSVAYASRVQSQMEDGEITEEEVEEVRDEQLMDEYANRLEQLKQQEEQETGEMTEEVSETESDEEEATQQTEQSQPSAQQQHQQRQHQPPKQSTQQPPPHPPQQPQQQYQQPPQSPQQTQQEFPTEGQQTVSLEELQELDGMLAMYEEEAQFEIQNLPPEYTAEAVGKLFVAQKARSLLRNLAGNGQS